MAILATDGVERVELDQPRSALTTRAPAPPLLSLKRGEIQARDNDLEDGGHLLRRRAGGAASVEDYDALLLPGGTVNPDKLRMDAAAVAFVRDFVAAASRSPRSATAR